uniref:Uncharacterized protein n=1 Tax=Anguilla anguilla TaxID=7936 RepID=A0A0E9RZQ2_ANGAN
MKALSVRLLMMNYVVPLQISYAFNSANITCKQWLCRTRKNGCWKIAVLSRINDKASSFIGA